jgi:hypothetical protein
MNRLLLSLAMLGCIASSLSVRPRSIEPSLCSIVPFPTERVPETTIFIGRAVAETVLAGAGAVRYSIWGGHWSANWRDRPIYGQRITVLRLAGANAALLSDLFAQRADSSVAVVPWDYDPGCKPTLWGRSFVWTVPESVGAFTVTLRPRSQWAGERPTFDAFTADIEPYPHGIFYQQGYRGTDAVRRGEGLSVGEFFDFYMSLPRFPRYGPDSLRYRKVLCDWAAAHPQQARRFPASRLVQYEPCK